MNRIFVNEFRLLSIVSLFIELAGNLRSYRWSCNAATANNSRKQLCTRMLHKHMCHNCDISGTPIADKESPCVFIDAMRDTDFLIGKER